MGGLHRDPDYKKKWHERNRERLLAKKRLDYRHIRGSYESRLVAFQERLNSLSDIERGYIAGLVDGEGSVSLSRIKGQSHHLSIQVSINNTDLRMMDWLVDRLGSHLRWQEGYTRESGNPAKAIARWYVCGRMAAALCQVIQPWLQTGKRERAALVIRIFAECPERFRMTQSEKKQRASFWEEFKSL